MTVIPELARAFRCHAHCCEELLASSILQATPVIIT